jgi:hypothetical protein
MAFPGLLNDINSFLHWASVYETLLTQSWKIMGELAANILAVVSGDKMFSYFNFE